MHVWSLTRVTQTNSCHVQKGRRLPKVPVFQEELRYLYVFTLFNISYSFLKHCVAKNVQAKQNLPVFLSGLTGFQLPTTGLNEVTGFNTRDGEIHCKKESILGSPRW